MATKTKTDQEDEDRPEFPSSTDVEEWTSYMEEVDGNNDWIAAGLKEFKRMVDLEVQHRSKQNPSKF